MVCQNLKFSNDSRKTSLLKFRQLNIALSLLLIALSLIGFNALASSRAESPTTEMTRKGVFLLASPRLQDPRFQHSVIYITEHNSTGAMGLIINRPTKLHISQAIPSLKNPLEKQIDPLLFFGGPVAINSLFILTQTPTPVADLKAISHNIYLSVGSDGYGKLSDQQLQNSQLYGGYTGWGPGQLEFEIARGDWHVVEQSPELIFLKQFKGLWESLIRPWM